MSTIIQQRIELCKTGQNPTAIGKLPSGWVVLGDSQFLRGYCLLLADPVVPDLNALDRSRRMQIGLDIALIGDALLEVTGAYRINYEILGNLDPALHVHILPRYLSEPDEYRKFPPFFYPKEIREATPFDAQRDRELMEQIGAAIRRLGSAPGY